MNFPITISDAALNQIKNIIARKNHSPKLIRLGVKGGGCSGFEYLFKLETNKRENDCSITVDDIEFLCDAKSAKFLENSELIWTGNLLGGGFKYNNPNAKRSCGCGTSFTPK